MNQIILTGNLGADPEIFYTNEGMHIASFSLAFKSTKDKTNWVKITCFKKTADLAERYLHKGAKVAVSGMLDQDKWEDDYGNKKSTFKVIANIIEFIKTDGRGFEDNNSENNNYVPQSPDEDVPF
ncbi:Single-stranded DNA-binding protein (fragment) [Desulfamplus magnetovallimortis]|uniref:Single-stranded DNA-binding protein n=1 Tax=Desulfamplus magnetovallimortis TaxID=1246637 RepID=A0A1W1HEH4_9BACT